MANAGEGLAHVSLDGSAAVGRDQIGILAELLCTPARRFGLGVSRVTVAGSRLGWKGGRRVRFRRSEARAAECPGREPA